MGNTIDIRGPINADTAYCEGELVARNVTLTLPEVTHVLGTINTALGEAEVPLYGLVDAMEATIQKIGVDQGLAKVCALGNKEVEYRWAQQVTTSSGAIKTEGCKAFLKFIPKVAMPSIEVAPGSNVELDIPGSVLRYRLVVDGKEILLVDKIAGICKINGIDYASSVESLL